MVKEAVVTYHAIPLNLLALRTLSNAQNPHQNTGMRHVQNEFRKANLNDEMRHAIPLLTTLLYSYRPNPPVMAKQ